MRIQVLTESSCIVYFGDDIDPALSRQVCQANQLVREALGAALLDSIPSYASLHLSLAPGALTINDCCRQLERLLTPEALTGSTQDNGRTHTIPVYYGPEVALDLPAVAQATGLSPQQVIDIHQRDDYRVYAIGFLPGFCFLGTLNAALHLPRKTSPRARVPAGSVAIARGQTAVYPAETPGGWHLIGRSPVDMRALCQAADAPLQIGDALRFQAMERDAFLDAGGSLT